MTQQSGIISSLNEEQRRAVYSEARCILVAAPPGSGKTACLAARFSRLVAGGARPEEILAITFTNRGAREMRGRVSAAIGKEARALNIGTSHSFCLRILKETRPGLRLYGRQDSERVLKDLGVKNPGRAADIISTAKNRGMASLDADMLAVLGAYQKRLEDGNALDLDDLVIEAAEALESGAVKGRFAHLLVDEYQDINPAQLRLIKALVKEGASIFAIGDPDQAIYGFRGADVRGFLEFEKDFAGCEAVRLKRNYRSAARIVKASSALILNNKQRVDNETEACRDGGQIRRIECASGRAEAGFIIKEIEAAMGGLTSLTAADSGDCRFSDFAVLFRTNRQADCLIDAFERSSIPYQFVTSPGATIAEFVEYVKAHEQPLDAEVSGYIASVAVLVKIEKPVLELILRAAEQYRGARLSEGLGAYLEDLILLDAPDAYDIEADRVSLMTLHTSKGLEWRHVFIAGVEDGLIPLRPKNKDFDMEEERRLLYVGMTRAKEALYLMSAATRTLRGTEAPRAPSPFLSEIPEGLVTRTTIEKKKTRRRPAQKGLFE